MNKIIIGDIPGQSDCSGILFDFISKWNKSIKPINLAAFLQGKNPWDGSFTNNPPQNSDGLLEELKIQLLSGAKTINQFKLFLKKLDHNNFGMCQFQAILDFYKEVFHIELSIPGPENRFPMSEKFMIFPRIINFSSNRWANCWYEYRQGLTGERMIDNLERFEPINFKYGSSYANFILTSLRQNEDDYLLTYEETYHTENLDEIIGHTYPQRDYKVPMNAENGISLKESILLSLFERWKNGRYFAPENDREKYLAIPCNGSACHDVIYKKNYYPVPIIFLSEDAISSTWASTKGGQPEVRRAKVYKPGKVYLL
ncbi:MAG: hypothetical protein WC564_01235 [Patescibacteria group bacterium]|jgi:hypothetical protein